MKCLDSIIGKAEPYKDLWNLAKEYSVICNNYTIENAFTNMPLKNGNCEEITDPMPYPNSYGISKSQLRLSNHIRMLWEQHIFWTVFAIKSIVENAPYTDLVVKRLLRNPKDFEAALKPLYGNEKAAKFSDLFTQHLVIASDLVKASKAGDTKAAEKAEKNWFTNANEIAKFLAEINPYWSMEEWKQMLYEHLRLTKSEAVYWLTKEYEKAINVYDEIQNQALGMADMMTNGIVRQFPSQF